MRRNLTPEELAAFADTVQRRRAAGETQWSIAGSFGISTSALRRRLRLAGVDLNPTPGRPRLEFSPQQLADMAARYRAGATLRAIGDIYGLSDKPIARALRGAGVAIRPRGRHGFAYERSS